MRLGNILHIYWNVPKGGREGERGRGEEGNEEREERRREGEGENE